jgi:hypothetical protein
VFISVTVNVVLDERRPDAKALADAILAVAGGNPRRDACSVTVRVMAPKDRPLVTPGEVGMIRDST